MPPLCPLTGKPGTLLRRKSAEEIFSSYASYCGRELPLEFKSRYFSATVEEYYSSQSGLRWYSPDILGDSDYYATLSSIYPWYYNTDTWDKQIAIEILAERSPKSILEIGCGRGAFIKKLHEKGLDAAGIDINEQAVADAKRDGLLVYNSLESVPYSGKLDTLCLFQTIEHVSKPGEFLKPFIDQFSPEHIVLSAPCFESLLGQTDDPLAWPPHHATSWSAKAFENLASQISYKLSAVHYDTLSFGHFNSILAKHGRKLYRLPYLPPGRPTWWAYRLGQMIGMPWATRAHSILAVLQKDT
jgi:2-polyprenyl-3-methyl-5-hydroxy-6-metoxy-1,4-benzoquinol methylase